MITTETGRGLISGSCPLNKELLMKIEITHRCRIRGKEHLSGSIVDVDDYTAKTIVGMGRGKYPVQKKVEPPTPPPKAETTKEKKEDK